MGTPITLEIHGIPLEGELADTPAGRAVAARLPLAVPVARWGEEYYGALGTPLGPLDGETREVMEVGEVAYWEPGNALCVFFGPTPASRGSEPRAASPVHPLGAVTGDWSAVRRVPQRAEARLSRRGKG